MKYSARIIDLPGLSNVGFLAPRVFRGAQPTVDGFLTLKRELAVRTVINLREFHDDEDFVTAKGMDLVKCPMTVFTPASSEAVREIVAIMDDPGRQPVYIHCQQGQDRTGYVCAGYRIFCDAWSYAEAMDELETYVLSPLGEVWFPIQEAVRKLTKKGGFTT